MKISIYASKYKKIKNGYSTGSWKWRTDSI